jgi:dihydrofolate reductase
MGRLVYSAIASLDGYIEDATGSFAWAAPDEEVHAFVNEQERKIGTYLYGRRMYETMRVWDDPAFAERGSAAVADYSAIWRAADKIVYSRTLEGTTTARTTLERTFDPEAVQRLKHASDRDVSVGGPGLAAEAFGAGLVDNVHLFLVPVLVGGGKPALPAGVRVDLEFAGHHRFAGGAVHLHYRVR